MLRDTTELEYADCNHIVDDQTIIIYDGDTNHAKTYKLINDKYLGTSEVVYTSIPSTAVCTDYTVIDALPSRYDFLSPYLHTMAILSVIILFYGAYKLIVHPWFRRI